MNALQNKMVIPSQIDREILREQYRRPNNATSSEQYIATKKIKFLELGEIGAQNFEDLVSGLAKDTLDDGEAATMAIAFELNSTPPLDERKAARICAEKFPELVVGCSIDIFAHEEVENHLGRGKLVMLHSMHSSMDACEFRHILFIGL